IPLARVTPLFALDLEAPRVFSLVLVFVQLRLCVTWVPCLVLVCPLSLTAFQKKRFRPLCAFMSKQTGKLALAKRL
ncbi:MAG: hypothetical protein EZS28_017701, partial [Streblomastix strix]